MITTKHYTGHRWTTEELKLLMQLWASKEPISSIAEQLKSTTSAVLKMVNKLRKNGVPLERRTKGHIAGRANRLWTQGEVEYLLRRRLEKATADEIAVELGRTINGVTGMIQKLRSEQVPIAMRGNGVRKLWDASALKSVLVQSDDLPSIEETMLKLPIESRETA